MSNKSGVSNQIISLPTGGGALQGIGETFKPDLFTGTGNFSVPIALPTGRNGFQPELNLVYSTGDGNGPFGLGWSLSVPEFSRKTSKGVPRYQDHSDQSNPLDTFVLSGTEDLVQTAERGTDGRAPFRPRTEGLFADIEHLFSDSPRNNFWEVRSKDGLVSVYGVPGTAGDDPAVIADPENRTKVFSWKLSETRDSFGNRIQYRYFRDRVEDGPHRSDQLYLQEIQYVDLREDRFLVNVAFEYGSRPDPFSTCRSGFEIRTRLRCRRIRVEIHPDESELSVRTYELHYLDERVDSGELPRFSLAMNGVSLLSRITVIAEQDGERQALPPLEFSYSRFEPGGQAFQPLVADTALPPETIGHEEFETIELFGNGLPDVVQMGVTTRFWRNLGHGRLAAPQEMPEVPLDVRLKDPGVQFGDYNGNGRADLLVQDRSGYFPLTFKGRFSSKAHPVVKMPLFNLEDAEVRFLDANGDGVVDLMKTGPFFELFFNDPDEGFAEVKSVPRVHDLEIFPDIFFSDPHVKLADLNGDGLQDIVVVRQGSISYWPYMGDGKWGRRVDMTASPEVDDPTVETGDGLDPSRLILSDIDGDGLDDAIYIQPGKITIWINKPSGRWSEPICFSEDNTCFSTNVPVFRNIDDIRLIDVLGNGTSGILWSLVDIFEARSEYQFLDLTGGIKPYLLTEMSNNMGAVTRVQYAPSTKFYLQDEEDENEGATKWKTPLPFPVQVVERVEVIDELSKGKLTKEYRYHHGYWNGTEREFRGFGMVEQIDSETHEDFNAVGLHGSSLDFHRVERIHFSPPTLTKTWFHLGDIDDETLEEDSQLPEIHFSDEYFEDDPTLLPRPEDQVAFLEELPLSVRREALRTLRGSVLRTELYAFHDLTRPFTVTETLMGIREEKPESEPESSRKRIFFPHPLAQRTTEWERGHDSMTSFTFTDDYDEFGQPRRRTQIACPRGWRSPEDTPAEPYLATHSRTVFAKPQEDSDVYIMDRVARTTTFEVVNDGSLTVFALKDAADSGSALQVIGQNLNYYDGPAFVGLANGQIGEHGALIRTENLVLTEEILKKAYESGDPAAEDPEIPPYLNPDGPPPWTSEYPEEFRKNIEGLPQLTGFTFFAGDGAHERGCFTSSTRNAFDFQLTEPSNSTPRGLLRAMRDPLGSDPAPGERGSHDTTIDYDAFDFLPTRVTDPVGLVTEASYDPRVLQPDEVIDPNNNRTHYTYTPLGLLKDIAVLGKEGELAGDEEKTPDGVQVVPSTRFEYDLLAFVNSRPDKRMPISVHTLRHVHHVGETDVTDADERKKTVETVEYSDGFGRLLQTRTLAEDDTVGHPAFGGGVLSADQTVDPGEVALRTRNLDKDPNVVVRGAQVYDNKGRVVEQFEPYFELESGFAYRPPGDDQRGQRISTFYDPLGRVIRTLHPDGSEQRVIHGVPGSIRVPDLTTPDIFEPTPWEAYTYDANDLAPLSHEPLSDGSSGPLLTDRAPRHHHFTPSSVLVDALGRTILAVSRNRKAPERSGDPLPPIEETKTRFIYDIRGNVLKVIDPRQREAFTYVYDLANNALRTENIDAGVRRVVLDGAGNEVERRDSKGAVVLQAYDRLQRPTRLWARDDEAAEVTLRERLEYGDGGDADQDPEVRKENRALNRLGALHRHYDEAGLLELAVYDFKGNVLEKNRRVVRDEAILAVFPARDDPDRNIRAFRVNWDPVEEQEQALLAEQAHETSATYDALNRVKRMLYPRDVDGERKELRPTYNRAGTLESVALDGQSFVRHIAYDAKGQRTIVALGSRVMTLYAYEPRTFRLSRMFSSRFSTNGEGTFPPEPLTNAEARKQNLHQDFGYDYDLVGNVVRIRDRAPESGILDTLLGRNALDRTFDYDALYRLTSAAGREVDRPPEQSPNAPFDPRPRSTDINKARAYDERYQYDALGNLGRLRHLAGTGSFTRQFAVKSNNNQLDTLTIGNRTSITFKYRYDDNGNLVQENTERHFEWDHSDRMKVFRNQVNGSEPTVHAHYLYDASGQRVKKLVRKQGGGFEMTIYIDGLFEHHRWGNAQNERNNQLHVMDDQQRIAMVRVGDPHPEDKGLRVQYHLGDHLGSSNLVVDEQANFINREEYTPYGETIFGSFGRKRYRFTGKERDEESGLNYHGARYYAPWFLRWASVDPERARFPEHSPFCYSFDNPLRFHDCNGRQPVDEADVHAYRARVRQFHQQSKHIWHQIDSIDDLRRVDPEGFERLRTGAEAANERARELVEEGQDLRRRLRNETPDYRTNAREHTKLEKKLTHQINSVRRGEERVARALSRLRQAGFITPRGMGGILLGGAALYLDYKQIASQNSVGEQAKEAAVIGGRWVGAALGAKYGAAAGLWGIAAGAVLGGLIGESGMRAVTKGVESAWNFIAANRVPLLEGVAEIIRSATPNSPGNSTPSSTLNPLSVPIHEVDELLPLVKYQRFIRPDPKTGTVNVVIPF